MQGSVSSNLPFSFIVTFWGKRFRDYFCELILPSLLSPGNIPHLNNKAESKFLIVTTNEDWEALQTEPIFILMQKYIAAVFFAMPMPTDNSQKMLTMSKGHKIASEYAYKNKTIGVFVTPDLVISDGSIKRLQELIAQGKSVVLSAAIRFQYEGSIAALKQAGHLKPDEPLVLSGRELMRAALPNLHSEVKRYIWDKPYYPEDAITSIWYSDPHNCVIHTFSWGPMAINYAAIDEHKTETFDKWTLDGDYVFANCGTDINKDIYVVTDTDELAFASFTTEEDLHFPEIANKRQQIPFVGKWLKQYYLRKQYDSAVMDPLKRKLIQIPILFHADDVSIKLSKLAVKSSKIVNKTIEADKLENEIYINFSAADIVLHKIQHSRLVKNKFINKLCVISVTFLSPIINDVAKIKHVPKHTANIINIINYYINYIKYITSRGIFYIKQNDYKKVWNMAKLVVKQRRWSKKFQLEQQRLFELANKEIETK